MSRSSINRVPIQSVIKLSYPFNVECYGSQPDQSLCYDFALTDMDVSNLFHAIFAAGRDFQTAVLCDQRAVTYGELRAETVRAGRHLKALGVAEGERVAILLNDSPEFIAAFVAIQSLGAIAVPINMALGADEQRLILNDCSARTAIVEGIL